MKPQQKSILKELPKPKFTPTQSAYEFISNDGEIMILLRRHVSFLTEMEQVWYVAVYYIKEDDGWLRSSTVKSFGTLEEFIRELDSTIDFSQAIREYKEAFAQANGMR